MDLCSNFTRFRAFQNVDLNFQTAMHLENPDYSKNRIKYTSSNYITEPEKIEIALDASRWKLVSNITIRNQQKFEYDNYLGEFASFVFLNSFDGLSFEALKKCKECNGWFVQVNKHAKNYCTPKCYHRSASKKYRAKMKNENSKKYQKELSAGKKRAKKSYKKKIKKILPNAVIK